MSCDDATSGRMPGPYTLVRPETRLSAQDVETICVAARQAEANTADGWDGVDFGHTCMRWMLRLTGGLPA